MIRMIGRGIHGLSARAIAGLACAVLGGHGAVSAQDAAIDQASLTPAVRPLEQIPVRVTVDSGFLTAPARDWLRAPGAGRPAEPERVFETEVAVEGAPWLRLMFDEVVLSGQPGLGDEAFLWITSLQDGARQVMTARDLQRWGNTSAYFNGDRVLVEVFAYPGSGPVRLEMSTVLAGPGVGVAPTSLCGPDNRVASTDPRSARVLPAQCTAFIIDDQTRNFLTAGHCASGLGVVQFNVPPSNPSTGAIVNPAPEHQYPVDPASKQSSFTTIGNDWAYFGVFPNSNTGLTPFQAQGSFYFTANTSPPVQSQTIRITGYGTDNSPLSANQTLQTDTGAYTSRSGTIIRYAVDTTGGNSGSGVFDINQNNIIGIHTNAGCTGSGGANQGTAIQNSGLQNALANPLGITGAADCNNNSVPDFVDIEQGAQDCNNNGIPDTCEGEAGSVVGDLNSTGDIDGTDLLILLSAWGAEGGIADLNNDGVVDGGDLLILLNNWGSPCG